MRRKVKRVCQVEGCTTPNNTEGRFCAKHYWRIHKYGDPNKLTLNKHNDSHSPEYNTWSRMKERCYRANNRSYPDYGGRGIKVCDRWLGNYPNFLEDMGRRPSPLHSIDRIDNDGDYSPDNCRWATRKIQNQNKRGYKNNTSGVAGVSYVKRDKVWRAYVCIDSSVIRIGSFKNYADAVTARKSYKS